MNNQVVRDSEEGNIGYRSVAGDRAELQSQSDALTLYAKANGLSVIRTILESGKNGRAHIKRFQITGKVP